MSAYGMGASGPGTIKATIEEINSQIREIENAIRIIEKNPKPVLVKNLKDRITSLTELIVNGNQKLNLPAYPDWIKDPKNKGMVQNWYAKKWIVDADTLATVEKWLNKSQPKSKFTPFYAAGSSASSGASPFPEDSNNPNYSDAQKADIRANTNAHVVSDQELERFLNTRSDLKPGEWQPLQVGEWEIGRSRKTSKLGLANTLYQIQLEDDGSFTFLDKSRDFKQISVPSVANVLDGFARYLIKENELKLFLGNLTQQPGVWKPIPGAAGWEMGKSKFSDNPAVSNENYQIEMKSDGKIVCLDKKKNFAEVNSRFIKPYAMISEAAREYIKSENTNPSHHHKKAPGK